MLLQHFCLQLGSPCIVGIEFVALWLALTGDHVKCCTVGWSIGVLPCPLLWHLLMRESKLALNMSMAQCILQTHCHMKVTVWAWSLGKNTMWYVPREFRLHVIIFCSVLWGLESLVTVSTLGYAQKLGAIREPMLVATSVVP